MQLQTHDKVTYVRANGEMVNGILERMSKVHQAGYIRDSKTDKIVAAPISRIQKL